MGVVCEVLVYYRFEPSGRQAFSGRRRPGRPSCSSPASSFTGTLAQSGSRHLFREYKLGPLVGKRTWGGLVGVLGFPRLMDGGIVTAPNLGFWTKDGFGVENEGVPPDVEVEQWPAEVIGGRDPQLEKAIEIALQKLKEGPPARLKRPAFPVRVKR